MESLVNLVESLVVAEVNFLLECYSRLEEDREIIECKSDIKAFLEKREESEEVKTVRLAVIDRWKWQMWEVMEKIPQGGYDSDIPF